MTEEQKIDAEKLIAESKTKVHPLYRRVGEVTISDGGLSKREYYAAMAMQGITASLNTLKADYTGQKTPEFLAMQSIKIADALIKALETPNP